MKYNYDPGEIEFLKQGFLNGFDIGYQGPFIRKSESHNLPFSIGNSTILWNKLMKEVQLKRVASPFEQVPFDNYIQSPIGLVPKAGSNQTRLIFHLSYQFRSEPKGSLNSCTPKHLCTVIYRDLDYAIKSYLDAVDRAEHAHGIEYAHLSTKPGPVTMYSGRTDARSAFRILPLSKWSWQWTVMKARDPKSGVRYYFIDKCLPFGASISCALFQCFSDALKFITEFRSGAPNDSVTNYLNDFLFVAILLSLCNQMIKDFIELCEDIGVPISQEKTVWALQFTIFLGILLDGKHLTLAMPIEKGDWAIKLLQNILDKKKVTVKELQILCGFLNFLTKAIIPGHTFLRRMYSKYSKVIHCPALPRDKDVSCFLILNQLRLSSS